MASITLIPKPEKDTRNKDINRSISLIKTDVKILNKVLANWIQQHIKGSQTMHDHVGFTPGMKEWFCTSINMIQHTNKTKNKNFMIILVYVENSLGKIYIHLW